MNRKQRSIESGYIGTLAKQISKVQELCVEKR